MPQRQLNANRTLLEDMTHVEIAYSNYTNLSSTASNASSNDDFPLPSALPISGSGEDTIDDFVYPPELNFTGYDYTNETTDGEFNVHKVIRFLDEHEWLVFVLIGGGILILLAIITFIIWFLCKNKKRVIRESDDPILTSTYEERFSWRRCLCCCCPESASEKERREGRKRLNSESNMEAYKRTKMPINYAEQNNSMLENRTYTVDDKNLAIYIDGIHGVPTLSIQKDQHRRLPPLPHH